MKGKCIADSSYEEVNNCHERALVFMHKVMHDINSRLGWREITKYYSIFGVVSDTNFLLFIFSSSFRCLEYGLITVSSLCPSVR